jgi:hypothetical protein
MLCFLKKQQPEHARQNKVRRQVCAWLIKRRSIVSTINLTNRLKAARVSAPALHNHVPPQQKLKLQFRDIQLTDIPQKFIRLVLLI